jgi:hypothetical protein
MNLTGCTLAVILGAASLSPPVSAQNFPRIGYVYPAGGRQGSSFQVVVGGQFLSGATNVYVCGRGVQGSVIDYAKPLSQQEFNQLREQASKLQERRSAALPQSRKSSSNQAPAALTTWSAADEKLLQEIRAKLQKLAPKRSMNPAIAEIVTLRITIATDAETGEQELRIGTPGGLSNPLRFWVESLPEISKPEARLQAGLRPPSRDNLLLPAPSTETSVSLPVIVNGQILPGGIDRYRFQARRGEHLIVAVKARALIPYLADAVPGWFQATVTLCDSARRELAFADHDFFRPDPVLHYEVLKDGEYALEIHDSLYRGRDDFIYRIALGQLPHVTGVFPLGGPSGEVTAVQLRGWNLPQTNVVFDARGKEPGVYSISIPAIKQLWSPSPIVFRADDLPEVIESEPNDTRQTAQTIMRPVIVNGRIGHPGDTDFYRFEGTAGEEIIAEINGRRLGSPIDSVLELTDSAGAVLARNDDHEDKSLGLETHHADSWLRALLPTNGSYWVQVRDAQRQGGPSFGYRLRVSPPRPEFELRVVPASVNVRAGASVPITVYALRKDGFTNEIEVSLKEAPTGIRLSGGRITTNQDQARLTLSAASLVIAEPFQLALLGRGVGQGRSMVQPVLPAEDMMQAFAYRHLVVAKELRMAVTGRILQIADVKVLSSLPLRIPAGGTTRLRLATPNQRFADRVGFELSDPPDGVFLDTVLKWEHGLELVLSGDDDVVKPGMQGNLIINVIPGESARPDAETKAQPGRKGRPLGSLPAIPFEVVAE